MKIEEIETNLQEFIGITNYNKLQDYAFEFACIEAEYLGIPYTHTQEYRRLHNLRREFTLRETYDHITESYYQLNEADPNIEISIPEMTFPDNDVLRYAIFEKYDNKKIRIPIIDILLKVKGSDLEDKLKG